LEELPSASDSLIRQSRFHVGTFLIKKPVPMGIFFPEHAADDVLFFLVDEQMFSQQRS
jgi:hypothetical protein